MAHFAHLVSGVLEASRQLKRIADALENQQQPEEITRTYRDVMKERFPHRVDKEFIGGVNGCPDIYFEGADKPMDCGPEFCRGCWDRPYRGEEIILE